MEIGWETMRKHDELSNSMGSRPMGGALVWLVLCLILIGSLAQSETPVERGDVLRFEVLNAPELSREAVVDVDGRVMLPLLGSVEVAGRKPNVIRRELMAAFKDLGLLTKPELLVEVAVYRKVYVGGSVGRPGAIDFVPGMTARQAVIAAGGLRLSADVTSATPEELLSAMASRRALSFRHAQTVARIARLRSELSGAASLSDLGNDLGDMTPDDTASIVAAEADHLTELHRRMARRERHGEELIDLITLELETLERQAALQTEESKAQKAEIDNARTLVERGLMPRPRLMEMLRLQSQLNRDRLDNTAFAARARQAAETVRFELLDETLRNREATRNELSAALAQKADLESRIAAIDLRLLSAGSGAVSHDIKPVLVIFRSEGNRRMQVTDALLDEPIKPGDVLDLRIEVPTGASQPSQQTPAALTSSLTHKAGAEYETDSDP